MAAGGRATLTLDYSSFTQMMNVTIRRVQRATKKATTAACLDIKDISLGQVPRSSNTLANSFYFDVKGSYSNFTADLGYGRGSAKNPRTGQTASEYMIAVHEDLSAVHPVGKAKFLEDAVREYQLKYTNKLALEIRGELNG